MITGLPIEGMALIGKVRSDGWRQRVAALVGVEPEPWTDETRKDPRASGVLFSWIQRHFRRCPKDASPAIVERFARAYLWNLLTQVVFPDGTGDTASWMFLDHLRDWDVKWSWGSAALAFLYRQLDGACMRSKPTSSLGGFVWALQAYISELDMLTYEQVNWRPYTFGVQQRTPPDYVETSVKLHKTNRQSNKTFINWEEHHMSWVDMWNAQRHHRVENDQTPDTEEVAYLRHLEWMGTEYRVIHKAAWTRSDCLDLLPSEAAHVAFNNSIRETVGAHLDYGSLHDRVGTELWRCINDSNVVLGRAPCPQTDELVRTTLQKVVNRCRTLAALLSCHGVSSTDVRARAQYTMDVQSSARPFASRPRSSSAHPSSSRAHASSSRAHVEEIEEKEESDNEAADPDFIEFGASYTEDAPQPSQPTQAIEETRRASSRNIRRPGWQNTPEGYVTKGKMAAKRGRK
uniref:Aminotransferase-like plant mobile domain-containing protein n=1 Tax=Hordeum vulgare subsp. vulgare TaxID=112509 RepID=A0A8I7BGK5_HORVV